MKILRSLGLTIAVATLILVSYGVGQQAYGWMPLQATDEAQQVDRLFSFLVSLGTAVFLGVTGMIGWTLITCRAERGDFSEGHPSRGDARLEILWTLGPLVLVLWIACQSQRIYQMLDLSGLNMMPSHGTVAKIEANAGKASQPTIEVLAKQWNWTFHYPENHKTSPELHLPAGQTVRLVLRSEDVLHGFYVPEFRMKQDIIPNHDIAFVFQPQRPGKYKLHDSQFSGTYFALMTADVYVESPEQYQQWLSAAASTSLTPSLAELEHGQITASSAVQPPPRLGSRWPTVTPKPLAIQPPPAA